MSLDASITKKKLPSFGIGGNSGTEKRNKTRNGEENGKTTKKENSDVVKTTNFYFGAKLTVRWWCGPKINWHSYHVLDAVKSKQSNWVPHFAVKTDIHLVVFFLIIISILKRCYK